MQVRELMNTPVVAVTANAKPGQVAELIRDHGCTTVPVLDRHCRLLGVVTAADLGRAWLVTHHGGPDDGTLIGRAAHTVAALMRTPSVTLTADADVAEAIAALLGTGLPALPVQDGGRVVGIVGWHDLLPYLDAPIVGPVTRKGRHRPTPRRPLESAPGSPAR